MASVTPPRQFVLDVRLFPDEPWARALVQTLNQYSQETTAALGAGGTTYKLLTVTTRASVADSFPIEVDAGFAPQDVRVAQVQAGNVSPGVSVTVQWQPLALAGKTRKAGRIRITNISGLSTNTTYKILLALE